MGLGRFLQQAIGEQRKSGRRTCAQVYKIEGQTCRSGWGWSTLARGLKRQFSFPLVFDGMPGNDTRSSFLMPQQNKEWHWRADIYHSLNLAAPKKEEVRPRGKRRYSFLFNYPIACWSEVANFNWRNLVLGLELCPQVAPGALSSCWPKLSEPGHISTCFESYCRCDVVSRFSSHWWTGSPRYSPLPLLPLVDKWVTCMESLYNM